MASAAWPDVEGIRIARGMLTRTVTTANSPAEAPLTGQTRKSHIVHRTIISG